MRAPGLLVLAGGFALLDWVSILLKRERALYLFKPGTMLFLMAWFALEFPRPLPSQAIGLLFALALCTVGDIMLLRSDRWFTAGLIAFLLGHAGYILTFNLTGLPEGCLAYLPLLAILLVAFGYMLLLRRGLIQSQRQRLLVPFLLYGVILSLSTWSAVATIFRPEWASLAAGFAAVGGLLFFLSDVILTYGRFVQAIAQGRFWVHLSYHLAQFALTIGVYLHLQGW